MLAFLFKFLNVPVQIWDVCKPYAFEHLTFLGYSKAIGMQFCQAAIIRFGWEAIQTA